MTSRRQREASNTTLANLSGGSRLVIEVHASATLCRTQRVMRGGSEHADRGSNQHGPKSVAKRICRILGTGRRASTESSRPFSLGLGFLRTSSRQLFDTQPRELHAGTGVVILKPDVALR